MNEELKAYASELVADGALSGTIRTDELTALLSRLEQAEQQVARVREFSRKMLQPHGQNVVVAARVVESLDRALDGEQDG